MIHRSCLVATPTRLYFADDQSCKILDPATGNLLTELRPPPDITLDTFWKWIALDHNTLFALIGDQEQRDPVIRLRRETHGWPWNPLSPGFNRQEHDWGFGRTLVAFDLTSGKPLWHHSEAEPIDSRALCMRDGKIFAFRFNSFLTCIDSHSGDVLWRHTPADRPELFEAIGPDQNRQDWRTNWRTTAFLKAGPDALYFAGPPVGKLVAVSTDQGRTLWQHPYGNYQLLLLDDALLGVGGQNDAEPARKFNPRTGAILAEIPLGRRACTRITGCPDSLFCRAQGGSTRLDLATLRPGLISPMRPSCHDGVTIAHGLLYWWPSTCDCNLTLYGITCLAPVDPQERDAPPEPDRLQPATPDPSPLTTLPQDESDWPSFRADNLGTVTSTATVPRTIQIRWKILPHAASTPTAPTAVANMVFVGDSTGIATAIDLATGTTSWSLLTGGDIHSPPTIWEHRALIGSADGNVYATEAKTGRELWRFRAAPRARTIPVYGKLQSTWPVASGVLAANGVAYCAAGIVNYDGTRVIALDARSGALRWENSTSGHLDPIARTGVSAQGQLLLHEHSLYLAGGNAVSPAIYDTDDGHCLNNPTAVSQTIHNNLPGSFSSRGQYLYKIGDTIRAAGRPLYAHPDFDVYDRDVSQHVLLSHSTTRAIAWINAERLLVYPANTPLLERQLNDGWGKNRPSISTPAWSAKCPGSVALAVGANAAVLADPQHIFALDLADGSQLWSHPIECPPVPWGLCIARDGTIVATLKDGTILALASH